MHSSVFIYIDPPYMPIVWQNCVKLTMIHCTEKMHLNIHKKSFISLFRSGLKDRPHCMRIQFQLKMLYIFNYYTTYDE